MEESSLLDRRGVEYIRLAGMTGVTAPPPDTIGEAVLHNASNASNASAAAYSSQMVV